MTWLHPLGLLGLAAIPALLALSLWRWRRREVEVSSLLLWREVAAERRQAPQARRRRQLDPLLLLRMAVALVLTAALCGPAWLHVARHSRRLVLVLDRSASMAARRPDGRSRWEACREELLRRVGRLDAGDRVELVAVPPPQEAALGAELEPEEAARRLRALAPADAPVETKALVEAAVEAARRHAGATVILATDDPPKSLPAGVNVLATGESLRNRGIVAFAARQRPDGRHEVLVGLVNASPEPSTAEVALLAGGREMGRQSVPLRPGGRGQAIFDAKLDAARLLEARLDGQDGLAADDRAWLARKAEPLRIAWIGDESHYLRRALAAQERVELVGLPEPPAEAVPRGCGLALYYRAVPKRLTPGSLVVVAPGGDVGALRPADPVAVGRASVVAPRDPLMEAVRLDRVAFGRARKVLLPPGFETLARADAIPLIGRWREGTTRILYVGIDPASGDWPLDPSFPIFWANVVANAATARGELGEFACVRPGEACQVGGGEARTELVGPAGERRELAAGVFRPERVGVYRAATGEGEQTIAASLLSEAESLAEGATAPLPPKLLAESPEQAGTATVWRLGGWAALAGLLLIALHGWLAARARGI